MSANKVTFCIVCSSAAGMSTIVTFGHSQETYNVSITINGTRGYKNVRLRRYFEQFQLSCDVCISINAVDDLKMAINDTC